jgi:ParB/Sulfiredoxin domain
VNPAVLVPMREIAIDDRLQPRQDGLSDDHVAALMETPENWPPIVLARIEGAKYLIDGFHRHEAACQLGFEEIAASIFDPAQGDDLFAIAFQLNAQHGRPLTLRDRKGYAVALLAHDPSLSDRKVGKVCGLHHETVGALRNARSRVAIERRKAGDLPGDVGLLDPIRWRKKATKEQKSIAGYVARLRDALSDPYEEGSTVDLWPSDAEEIARACIVAMGAKRATETLEGAATDASFIVAVADAAQALVGEGS